MAAAQEMTFRFLFMAEGQDALSKLSEQQIEQLEEMGINLEDILAKRSDEFIKVEKMLALQKDVVKTAEVMTKLRSGDVDLLKAQQKELLAAKATLLDIMSTPGEFGNIQGPQLETIQKLNSNIERVDESIDKALDSTNAWKEALKEVGLDKVSTSAKKLMSVGGQVGFWAGMFAENAKQSATWKDQNYELYGSMNEVAGGVRDVTTAARVLQKEATAASKALLDVAIDKSTWVESATALADFGAATGASVNDAAKLAKQYEVLGFSTGAAAKQYDALRSSAKKYGITGKDMDVLTQFMTKHSRQLSAAVGGSEKKMAEAGNRMAMVSGLAKAAGMDMSELGQIFESLTEDATQYIVLLQDGLSASDPGTMFLHMAGNAEEAVESLKDVDYWLQQKLSKSIYGMPYDQLVKMNDAFKEFAVSTGHSEEELRKMLKSGEKLPDQLAKDYEEFRRLNEPGYAFKQLMDDLKNIFVTVIGPIVQATAVVIGWIQALMEYRAARWIVAAIGGLIAAIVLLKWTLGGLAILGTIIPLFKKFGGAVTATTKAASGGGGLKDVLKSMGTGLKDFFKGIMSIKLKDVWQAIVAIALMGVVLIGLAWAAKKLEVDKLAEMGFALVLMAGSMWIMSKVMGQAFGPGFWKGIAGMVVLGLVLVGLAWAVSALPTGALIMAGLGILALAGAMWLLGTFAVPIAIGALAVLAVAAAMAVLGAALLIPSLSGENLLAVSLGLLGFAGSLIAVAVASIPFAVGAAAILIAAGVLLGAMLVGAAMIIPAAVFWAACKLIGSGFEDIFEGFGGDISAIVSLGTYIGPALHGLASGIDAIVDSSWYKFWKCSDEVGEGLGSLMAGLKYVSAGALQSAAEIATMLPALAAGISAFSVTGDAAAAFYWSSYWFGLGMHWLSNGMYRAFFVIAFAPKVAAGLSKLGAGMKSFGSGSGFARAAQGFSTAIRIIGDGLMYYGWYVENAANRVLRAVLKVGLAQQYLQWMGIDEVIKSAATVTVKADVEDKKKESEDRITQTELLEDIKSSIQVLGAAVAAITVGDTATRLAEVRDLLNTYLPDIAEGDSKLSVGHASQW